MDNLRSWISFILKSKIINTYNTIYNWLLELFTIVYNKFNNIFIKKKIHRCTHNADLDDNWHQVIKAHDECLYSDQITSGRTIRENKLVDLSQKIMIEIPMIYHIIDPNLAKRNIDDLKNHINQKIITRLNSDFNINKSSFATQYIDNVSKLFTNADPEKKKHYLNLVNTLPNLTNVKWNFVLNNIIIKSIPNLFIKNTNEDVFRSINVVDPDKYLNIIVLPGREILGIAVFPFMDRDPINPSVIDNKYKYRNGILINTSIFEGTTVPYDKFRTFTHEIGHWAGLLHTFDNVSYRTSDVTKFGLNKLDFDKTVVKFGEQDQDFVGDLVSDTYPQINPTYGTVYDKIIHTKKKVGNKYEPIIIRSTPYAIIFEKNNNKPNFFNFMDYTDDAQMCMFSHFQMLRMVYMMSRFRPGFVKIG